jgi:hypothetical protein
MATQAFNKISARKTPELPYGGTIDGALTSLSAHGQPVAVMLLLVCDHKTIESARIYVGTPDFVRNKRQHLITNFQQQMTDHGKAAIIREQYDDPRLKDFWDAPSTKN